MIFQQKDDGKKSVETSKEEYELCQISKMKLFAKLVNGWKTLTILEKVSS